jgi:hypothetical protein
MKTLSIAAPVLAAALAISGCANNPGSATHAGASMQIPPTASTTTPQPATATSPDSLLQQAIEEQTLKKLGVQPGSRKAAIVAKYRSQLRSDPLLRTLFDGSTAGLESPRIKLMALDGMARVTAEQRAQLWSLYDKVASAHLPADCYGLRDHNQISARLMTFPNFTDDQAEEYMQLTSAMLDASARHDPEDVPTTAAHSAATVALGKLLMSNIKDKTDADRLARVMVNPATASTEDACWMTRMSIHAIALLDPSDKEVVLAGTADKVAENADRQLFPVPPAQVTPQVAAPAAEKL